MTHERLDLFLGEEVSPQILSAPLPDSLASQVVDELKREADRYWYIDPNRSLQLAERILAIGRARDDLSQTALGLMARGDALKFLGHTAEAWEALDQAGAMFEFAGDEVGWARTRIGRLSLSVMLKNVAQALDDAGRAQEIFVRYEEREKLLRLHLQTAYVYNYLGEQAVAIERFRAAFAIAEELGEAGQAYSGVLYLNMGSAYESMGDLHKARDHYQRAREMFARRGESLNLAVAETNLAYLEGAQGNYRVALRLLNQVLEQVGEHLQAEETRIKWHLLDCYISLNRQAEARELARQVVAEQRSFEDAFELGRALLQLAMIEAELANFDAAQAALDEAEGIFTSLGAASWTATVSLRRGQIGLQRGDPATAIRMASEAAAQFSASGQQVSLANTALLLGQASLALGDLTGAEQGASAALRAGIHNQIPSLRYSGHHLLGQISQAKSSPLRAERHFQAAAATVERIQRDLTITMRPGFLEDKGEAWRALIALQLNDRRVGRAFETLERAKSQVLLGYLANRDRLRWAQEDEYSRGLIEELDSLRAEHQWFYRLAHDPPQGSEHSISVDPGEAIQEFRLRERRMRAITETLYLHNAEGRAAFPAPTPSLASVQGALDESTLLVEFYNDGTYVWAFLLDQDGIAAQRLPLTVESLHTLLAQWQVNLSTALKVGPQAAAVPSLTRLAQRILRKLYDSLLQPLDIQRLKKRRIIFVPYGALHYLPFHLLYDGSAYLIERAEVLILPSAGLILQPALARSPGAVILAHSWEGRLSSTLVEAGLVQQLFGGEVWLEEAASREALASRPAQVLHIAAHGQYRLDQPDLSYIQLADGQLYADDLLQGDLSYELVVLSACETGRANVSGGDELIGLGRGFLYAGAGALLLSLWQVPDRAALRLMEGFYRALRAGASKAAALRETQIAALAEAGLPHPAFWGAFQLVGNPGPLSRLPAE